MKMTAMARIGFVPVAIAGLVALLGPGCSPQASEARHLESADHYFDSGEYDQAEIEYLNVLHLEPLAPRAIGRLGQIYFDEGRLGQVFPYLLKGSQLQPDNLDLRLKLGLFYLTAGKLKEAREAANFILERKPDDPDAPLLLADAAISQNDIDEARQRLQKLPGTAPAGAPVLVALGTLKAREQKFPEAEAAFKQASTVDPKLSSAWSALGALYWAQGNVAKADEAFATAAGLSPVRSAKRLQYAQFKIQGGNSDAGRHILEEITQKSPDYLPAWMMLAELAAREKKYPESAALNARVLSRDPTYFEALILGGRLKQETGDTAKAVTDLENVLKLYPQSPPAHYQLALAYLANGDVGKAAASLTQAIALAPNYTEAIVMLAGINIRRGDSRGAIVSLKQLVQQRPDAPPAAWLLLAEAYSGAGDFEDALAVYHRLEQSYPKNPQTSWLTGLAYLRQNRRDDARQAFDKALELSPDYLPALEQLIDLDIADKHYPEALHRVESRLEKKPGEAGLHLLRAKIFIAQQDTKQAEADLLKALELQPDSTVAYYMLARMYVATNQQQKALADLQEISAKKPKEVEAVMLIGVIYDQMKDYPAARDSYEKLLAINPRFSPALNNLAYLYSEKFNELDKAYEMAQRARELHPNEPHTADTLGWILFQKRDYPWALSLLQESASRLPDSAEVQFHLGAAHYMLGEEDPARIALQRALQLTHDFSGSDDAEKRLAVLSIDPRTAGPEARAALEKAVAERPGDPVALTRLAAIYERAGERDQAIHTSQLALQASPKNVNALMNLARLYAAHQENEKAFDLAKTARELAPGDAEVVHLLGRLAYETGNFPWAVTLMQESATKQPDDPDVLYDFAMASYSVGRIPESMATMRLALDRNSLFPRADDARRFLEMTALAASPAEAVAAIDRVQQILKSSPADAPALMALAEINEQKFDFPAAEQAYEKVLARYPEFSPATRRLAILSADSAGDIQKAFDLAAKARETYPSDPEVAKALGIAVYRQGNFTRAVGLLKESAAQRPADAVVMFYLGMAHYRLKAAAEGRAALEKALELNLRADLAAEARKALAELK